MKLLQTLVITLLFAAGFTTSASAQQRPCTKEGMQQCFSFQFLQVRHTPKLERLVRSDLANSGKNVLRQIEQGTARFDGRRNGGTLFIWLKADVPASFRIPAETMREFQYSKSSGRPKAAAVSFETKPQNFPLLDDPRLPGLGVPDYVLAGKGGNAGVGWSMPKSLLDKIAYVVFCPYGSTTSYPDRRGGKSYGIHFTPEDIRMWQKRDWEYTLEPVLYM